MSLLLVRHGHAGHKEQPSRTDRRRGLTQRGLRQAEQLVDVIVPLRPRRIISSPFTRCLETVAPLAAAIGIEVETDSALTPSRTKKAFELVRDLPSGVVVCTHGEVMGSLLARLAEEGGVDLERRPPGLKGCVWELTMRSGKLLGAKYIAP